MKLCYQPYKIDNTLEGVTLSGGPDSVVINKSYKIIDTIKEFYFIQNYLILNMVVKYFIIFYPFVIVLEFGQKKKLLKCVYHVFRNKLEIPIKLF